MRARPLAYGSNSIVVLSTLSKVIPDTPVQADRRVVVDGVNQRRRSRRQRRRHGRQGRAGISRRRQRSAQRRLPDAGRLAAELVQRFANGRGGTVVHEGERVLRWQLRVRPKSLRRAAHRRRRHEPRSASSSFTLRARQRTCRASSTLFAGSFGARRYRHDERDGDEVATFLRQRQHRARVARAHIVLSDAGRDRLSARF